MIDKHELAARVERLFRLLLAPGTAAVLEGSTGLLARPSTYCRSATGTHELYAD